VAGAGPQALTLCAHLLDRYPSLSGDLVVFDPAAAWLRAWDRRFAALDIGWLRSPAVHHPHPEPYALLEFRTARPEFRTHGYLPSTELFGAFCADVAARFRLGRVLQAVSVGAAVPAGGGVRLDTDRGSCRARVAVLATNPGRPRLPGWAEGHDGVLHAEAVDLRNRRFDGRTVLVIGGGLTAAHMALGVAARGGHAVIVARRSRRVRPFDTDPGWLGPKEMNGFSKEPSFDRRVRLIREARDGGSIPPAYADALDRRIEAGTVTWRTATVLDARPGADGWQVTLAGGPELVVDEVWLATGWEYDVEAVPVFDAVRPSHPAAIAGGLPGLDTDLAWPGTDVFVMGALAGLQLGPTALNLSGARQGAARITAAIGSRLGLPAPLPTKGVPCPRPAASRTDAESFAPSGSRR
jgi:cation diffusion facilitator CzcD-associated flavoprotein CzcO